MSVLTVAPGQSIQDAVNAAAAGDTIDVQAGSYNDQFLTIETSLTLQAVGGEVVMTEDTSPPDGKALITEGQPSLDIAINGFDISGVSVPDSNGAAIRYEGGQLSLSNDYFHNNQEGILAASDPNGSITIDHSEFAFNGDGSGSTHNIYVNQIGSLTITNSYIHDAIVGHEIKSRAEDNTIENNRIFDNNGSVSYSVDLPNGGNATISNNVIEQGPNTQNPYIFAYGEEGQSNPGTSVSVTGNTIVNDDPSGRLLLDPSGAPISFSGNQSWDLSANGDTVLLAVRPSLDTSSLAFINPTSGSGDTGGNIGSSGGSTGNSGGGGTDIPPPPPPPPALTLDQYHAMELTDFINYAAANPSVWLNSSALTAIVTEITSPVVLAAPPPGDLWT